MYFADLYNGDYDIDLVLIMFQKISDGNDRLTVIWFEYILVCKPSSKIGFQLASENFGKEPQNYLKP